jgi:hypothetical protein
VQQAQQVQSGASSVKRSASNGTAVEVHPQQVQVQQATVEARQRASSKATSEARRREKATSEASRRVNLKAKATNSTSGKSGKATAQGRSANGSEAKKQAKRQRKEEAQLSPDDNPPTAA